MYLETERPDQAREWFERAAANDFTDVGEGINFSVTMHYSAHVVRRLRDGRRAAILYERLRPYAARQLVVGNTWLCWGSASRPLGMLAATMGNWEEAERHFEDALAFDEKVGNRPYLARSQYEYADMLQERGLPEGREKPLGLVNQALATFEELGMKKDVERALALKLQLQGIDPTSMQSSIGLVAAAVYVDKPDLRSHAAPDGTVTILFTDIEGSTALAQRLGDRAYYALLGEHNRILREQVQAHGGHEVKSTGDGFMVAFGSARRALQCAIDIQRAFAEHNESLLRQAQDEGAEPQDERAEPVEAAIRVRIGLHTGEAIKEAEDFYGKSVILAARIADEAQGGEILVSSLLKELTESAGDIAFAEGREVELRGLSGIHRVFAVAWE
jgi:class 3 adenylate cyclase